jgi:2,5-diketo-D-gluconate reductase A
MPQPAFNPTLTLNDGHKIPQLGLGTWQTPEPEAAASVRAALQTGYRLIDTAAIYNNENGVGTGLRESGLPREKFFLTTKLWNDQQGYDSALRAFDASLKKLRLDYIDLYLIHWPAPQRNNYVDSWRALVRLQQEKRVRSIGVSNFQIPHLEKIIAETGVTPAVNQIELHPDFQQPGLQTFHSRHGILTQSWSPLGQGKLLSWCRSRRWACSILTQSWNPLGQGKLLTNATIQKIAAKHGKTAAQTIIRWHLDSGLLVIPKSVHAKRITENFAVFDFTLDHDDLTKLAALDSASNRIGPNPDTADF